MQEGVFQQTREGRDNKDYHIPTASHVPSAARNSRSRTTRGTVVREEGETRGKGRETRYLNSTTPIQKNK